MPGVPDARGDNATVPPDLYSIYRYWNNSLSVSNLRAQHEKKEAASGAHERPTLLQNMLHNECEPFSEQLRLQYVSLMLEHEVIRELLWALQGLPTEVILIKEGEIYRQGRIGVVESLSPGSLSLLAMNWAKVASELESLRKMLKQAQHQRSGLGDHNLYEPKDTLFQTMASTVRQIEDSCAVYEHKLVDRLRLETNNPVNGSFGELSIKRGYLLLQFDNDMREIEETVTLLCTVRDEVAKSGASLRQTMGRLDHLLMIHDRPVTGNQSMSVLRNFSSDLLLATLNHLWSCMFTTTLTIPKVAPLFDMNVEEFNQIAEEEYWLTLNLSEEKLPPRMAPFHHAIEVAIKSALLLRSCTKTLHDLTQASRREMNETMGPCSSEAFPNLREAIKLKEIRAVEENLAKGPTTGSSKISLQADIDQKVLESFAGLDLIEGKVHTSEDTTFSSVKLETINAMDTRLYRATQLDLRMAQRASSTPLLNLLRTQYKLVDHLELIWSTYLFGNGHALDAFYSTSDFSAGIVDRTKAIISLRECLTATGWSDRAVRHLDFSPTAHTYLKPNESFVNSPLRYTSPFPTDIVIHSGAMSMYQDLFCLLQMLKIGLKGCESGVKGTYCPREGYILRMKLLHALRCLLTVFVSDIIQTSIGELRKVVEEAEDLYDVVTSHNSFIRALHRRCFLGGQNNMIMGVIKRFVGIGLNLQELMRHPDGINNRSLNNLRREHENSERFLIRALGTMRTNNRDAELLLTLLGMDAEQ
eukprot:Clim_evm50s210 gene=Clim_evmTU50s210